MNEAELTSALDKLRADYKSQYDAYPEVKAADGSVSKQIPASDVEGLQKMLADMNEKGATLDLLAKARETRAQIDEAQKKSQVPVNPLGVQPNESKTLVNTLLSSDEYAARNRAKGMFNDIEVPVDMKSFLDMEAKATMTTSAGFAPFVIRDGKVVPAISRPPQFLDFLRIEPTGQNAVKFMKQTTRTNAADAKAEAAALAEATIVYTEATVDIRKIGVYLPVTEEQLEDETEMNNIVGNDLRLMVRQELDEQVTVGSGVAPNITGVTNASGILTQARGSDPHLNALMKAMTKVRVDGRSRPNLVLLHSTDYQNVLLTATSDGVYLLGSPSEAPLSRIWGLNVATSEALTAGTGVVIDTDMLRLKMRKDVTIAASDSHSDYFIKNILALRAHVRAGLQIMRDEAICTVTGL